MRRIATLSLFIFALVLGPTACGSSDNSSTPPSVDSAPGVTDVEPEQYLKEPYLVDFCDDESGICAKFPAEAPGTLIKPEDVNANSTFTEHRRISSTVSFHVGDGYSDYCSIKNSDCDETETYMIDVLPDNKINSAAALKLDEGCAFKEVTVTGVAAKLKSCTPDGIPSVEQLIIFNQGNIFVASAESSGDGYDAEWLEPFFGSIGFKAA